MAESLSQKKAERKARRREIRRKGVILLPSMLTALSMFTGFFAIIHTVKVMANGDGNFWAAGIAIIIASFIDGMDGRMARLMKAESEFGSQFDSIADVVSFGVAPAVLVYAAYLHPLERWGWLGAFMFVACAGIRLARFNVASTTSSERKYFKGLSSPVAAGGIALTVVIEYAYSGRPLEIAVLCYTIFLSLLMVSNVRFRSFKKLDAAREKPVSSFLIIMAIIVLIFSFQEFALLGFFILYLFWGLMEELTLFRRRRRSDPNVPIVPFGDRVEDEDSIV
jgi:CDP-diacylglycerol--serine O-phosphatidyltransferase